MLCDTSGVGGFPLHFSTGSPFGYHPRLRMVCPPLGTVGADWEVSFFSPSPLLHFSTSPRVHPSGITRGYAWCVPSGDSECGLGGFSFLSLSTLHGFALRASPAVTHGVSPAGDSGWTMSYFFSYQENKTMGRSVFSLSCGLICRAQKYNKGVS